MSATKSFCMADARAGAPYACRDGRVATILKWDARSDRYPLVGVKGDNDEACTWAANGKYDFYQANDQGSDLVMTPLGYIEGKPVFVGDEFEANCHGEWQKSKVTPSLRDFSWCRWPEPAQQYPVTGMTDDELNAAVQQASGNGTNALRRGLANAALRHAIDNATVATLEAYDQCRTDLLAAEQRRDERDMEIAKAVRGAIIAGLQIALQEGRTSFECDLATVITNAVPA